MKKLLAVLLSVMMLVSGFALTVSADIIYNDAVLDWDAFMGTFSVGDAYEAVGETFTVPVSISNNPGIVSLKLAVNYDADSLQLVDVAAGDFGTAEGEEPTSLSFGPVENNPFIINWMDALATENNTNDGVLAYLTFEVLEGAAAASEISISYNPNDVFDADLNNVEFLCTVGTFTLKTFTYGDVNEDDKINIRDLGLIQQYLNNWDVTINLDAADVLADGKINIRDLGLLQQYLNNWDVTLGK